MQSDMTGTWTPVALAADLPAKTVMPANLGGQTIALWRTASGQPAASADRCPHRGMRLSHGFVRDEALSCIYHGWRYSKSGACIRIPANPGLTPPETIRVETFKVVEQDGIVWASNAASQSEPPRFSGVTPLRTLTVCAPIAAIEAAADTSVAENGLMTPAGAPEGLCLLLSDLGDGQTLMHVLLTGPSKTSRIDASRFAEVFRRRVEATAGQGAAA